MIQKEDLTKIKEDRGPSDLELQIDMLKKQKEYLQKQCRRAGEAVRVRRTGNSHTDHYR